jgi:lysyl oxidase
MTCALLAAMALALGGTASSEAAGQVRYPNLRTLPPDNLYLARVRIAGSPHSVLRFGNTAWNAGPGPLELSAKPEDATSAIAYQRLLDSRGRLASRRVVGRFVFHPSHNHFHLENFARYELWTRAGYDAWVASGRTTGAPIRMSKKVSFCLLDTFHISPSRGPGSRVYANCTQSGLSGISVGWGDWYSARLPGQLIDLGGSMPPAGDYVLRSIADPQNILWESPRRATDERESQPANAAVTPFRIATGIAYEQLAADGFESGTLARWTAHRGVTVQSGAAYSGARSARLSATGGPAFLGRQIRLGRTGVQVELQFRILSQRTETVLAAIRDERGRVIAEVSVGTRGRLRFRNGVMGWTRAADATVSPGVWHRLQLRLRFKSGLDRSVVTFDGAGAYAVNGRFGSPPIGRFAVGDPHRGHRFVVALDEVLAESFR